MKVYKLTLEQYKLILSKKTLEGGKFNPIQDKNDNYIITQEEVDYAKEKWIKELPQIEFEPKEIDLTDF